MQEVLLLCSSLQEKRPAGNLFSLRSRQVNVRTHVEPWQSSRRLRRKGPEGSPYERRKNELVLLFLRQAILSLNLQMPKLRLHLSMASGKINLKSKNPPPTLQKILFTIGATVSVLLMLGNEWRLYNGFLTGFDSQLFFLGFSVAFAVVVIAFLVALVRLWMPSK